MSSILARKPAPISMGNRPARALGQVPRRYPIFCHARVLDSILDYSAQHLFQECGGFLIGGAYSESSNPESHYVEIRHFVPARETIGAAASIRFTHATWSGLSRDLETRYPTEKVVGWHHTHPGLGIFLSAHDRFIHTHFFSSPWQIAMVVDPRSLEFAFFQWDQNKLVDVGFVWVPPPTPSCVMASTPKHRVERAVS